jgi:hypothetical protein
MIKSPGIVKKNSLADRLDIFRLIQRLCAIDGSIICIPR